MIRAPTCVLYRVSTECKVVFFSVANCHGRNGCRINAILTGFWEHAGVGIGYVIAFQSSRVAHEIHLGLFCFTSLGISVAVLSAVVLNQRCYVYIQTSNHYVAHLKVIYCYMSITSPKKKMSSAKLLQFCSSLPQWVGGRGLHDGPSKISLLSVWV